MIHLYFLWSPCVRLHVHGLRFHLVLLNLLLQDCVVCNVRRSLPSGADSWAAASPSELLAKFYPAGYHHPGNLPRG